MDNSHDYILVVITMIFSALGYLLHQKDSRQEKDIQSIKADCKEKHDLLFRKHDEDEKELQEVKIILAGKHYERDELDAKFNRLEGAIRESSEKLGEKFDLMSKTLLQILVETRKDKP